jgi:pyridoxamine 5'-phosphate oxidase
MSIDAYLNKTRKEYQQGELDERSVLACPFSQFRAWFDEAMTHADGEPNACALATVGADLRPTVRMLLLKAFDERGFVFFTNYSSRKAEQLAQNPHGALLFYWNALERQVRLEGSVEPVTIEESEAYFESRPLAARIAASVSRQSEPAPSRAVMEEAFATCSAMSQGTPVKRPAHWGGYRLVPARFEFWQGRENRLHDRIIYKQENGLWSIERLWP